MIETGKHQRESPVYNGIPLLNYMAGFFDGEGCVLLDISEDKASPVGYDMCPSLKIVHQNESATKDILVEFCEHYELEYTINAVDRDGSVEKFRWGIYSRRSVKRAVELLSGKCLHKSEQLEVFQNEILPRLSNQSHKNRRGFLEIVAWKDVLDARKGGSRGKYNLRHFESEWGMKLDKRRAGLPEGWLPDYSRPKRGESA